MTKRSRRPMVALIGVALLTFIASAAMAGGFADAPGGVIRWLDKLSGETGTADIQRGQTIAIARLAIRLDACRYPEDNPAAEAEAHLTIIDTTRNDPVFSGWMLASSPGLSAMEHPRYDVWVVRCDVPGYSAPETDDPATNGDESTESTDGAVGE